MDYDYIILDTQTIFDLNQCLIEMQTLGNKNRFKMAQGSFVDKVASSL